VNPRKEWPIFGNGPGKTHAALDGIFIGILPQPASRMGISVSRSKIAALRASLTLAMAGEGLSLIERILVASDCQ
jgi:hypothetical protein